MTEATIRRVRLHEHGGPEVLRYETAPLPEPGPGQVRVRVEAIALNHLDLWVRRGVAGAKFPLPLVVGSDGAGRVDALGAGVGELTLGQRVCVLPGMGCGLCVACLQGRDNECSSYKILGESIDGTAAEAIVIPASNAMPAPGNLDAAQAASFGLTFLTAWNMLVHKARVQPGQRVLIHAAASGVSAAAIQIARHLGALVAATASSPQKRALATQLGADAVLPSRDAAWFEQARGFAPLGFDVVFDHVGADTFAASLRLLRKGGRYVFCGATSGFELKTDFRVVFFRNLEILGSTMGRKADLHLIAALFASGRLVPNVDRVFAFDALPEAHRQLEERRVLGKIVVTLN